MRRRATGGGTPVDAFAAEYLPGARNAPDVLSAEPAGQVAPDRAGTVVIYCLGPYRNRFTIAAATFARLGYRDVRVYAEGKQDWAEAGLSFESDRLSAIPGAAVGAGRSE